jgi:hypothetical protein
MAAKKSSSKKASRNGSANGSSTSSASGRMSKSRASKVLRGGRGGNKSKAALALSGQKSKKERRASGQTRMYERNLAKPWTAADDRMLRELEGENTPTRVIGLQMGRSEASIYDRASEIGLSLKPTNQSPNKGRMTSGSGRSGRSGGRSSSSRRSRAASK